MYKLRVTLTDGLDIFIPIPNNLHSVECFEEAENESDLENAHYLLARRVLEALYENSVLQAKFDQMKKELADYSEADAFARQGEVKSFLSGLDMRIRKLEALAKNRQDSF